MDGYKNDYFFAPLSLFMRNLAGDDLRKKHGGPGAFLPGIFSVGDEACRKPSVYLPLRRPALLMSCSLPVSVYRKPAVSHPSRMGMERKCILYENKTDILSLYNNVVHLFQIVTDWTVRMDRLMAQGADISALVQAGRRFSKTVSLFLTIN